MPRGAIREAILRGLVHHPLHQALEASQSFGFGVDLAMAGLAEHLAVRQFVVAARDNGLLVVELSRPGATSAVVRA
jgi:hypothetical protein